MTKTFCDNCEKEVQDSSCEHVHTLMYGRQEKPITIEVLFSFGATALRAPELCLSCQAKLLRDFADMVERG